VGVGFGVLVPLDLNLPKHFARFLHGEGRLPLNEEMRELGVDNSREMLLGPPIPAAGSQVARQVLRNCVRQRMAGRGK
jgi:hypothetical protein